MSRTRFPTTDALPSPHKPKRTTIQMKKSVLPAKFYLWLFVATILTFLIHESAHWLMGTALGYTMTFHLNGVAATTAMQPAHKALVDAAGPLVTVLQGVVAFMLVMRSRQIVAYAFLYIAAFMRLLATAISLMHLNDEARLSQYLGLGTWTLPLLVTAGLVFLVWRASRSLQLTWMDHLLCYLAASASIALVVGFDRLIT